MRVIVKMLRNSDSSLQQQPPYGDQWQADQSSGIGAANFLEQGNTEAFAFKASGAVVGGFQFKIPLDFREIQFPETHRGQIIRVQLLSISD